MSTIPTDFNNKYSFPSITKEQMMMDLSKVNKPSVEERNEMIWSGISISKSGSQQNTNSIYSSSEIDNQRASMLNSTEIDKVDIITRLKSDSNAVNTIINNNISEGVKDVFSRFGVTAEVSNAIQSYQDNDPLSQVNSLVSQGIHQLQQSGANNETVDKFLYQLSTAIDEKVTQSRDEINKIPALAEQLSIEEKQSIFQSDIPTLRVTQSRDTEKTVVSKSFEITNQEGDIIKIDASHWQRNSISNNDFKEVNKNINITITEGNLSAEEQKQFNQFLDDFSQVTNEILEGDLEGANKAFSSLNIADYGFKNITQKDKSYQLTQDEDVVHSYNKELGHVYTGDGINTQRQSSVIDKSYVKGGALHNVQRNADSNLANFDMKYANTHEIGSSGINKDLRYDGQQDELFGLSQQYGQSRDGLVLQDNQGDLYQYQYNKENREDSGWAKIDKEQVNYHALKENQRFNSFKLNTEDSNNITLTHLATNSVKDYGTSLVSEPTNKQYSDKYENQVFEDKSGNLYQYQFNGDYQSSGWSKVEATQEILQLFEERFEKEGYMHNYLAVDERTNSMQFASLLNGGEHRDKSDSNINMQILQSTI